MDASGVFHQTDRPPLFNLANPRAASVFSFFHGTDAGWNAIEV